jgi:transglutaminase-like putative cysteine protease
MIPRETGPGAPALLWLIALMAMATLPFITQLPPWLGPVLAALAWWRWHRERRGQPPPPTAARMVVSAAVIALLALSGGIGLGIDAAVPLFVSFLWIKLLELRGERDMLMGCYLCGFLAAANLLTDQGIVRTLFAVATIGAVVAVALRFHLGRGGAAPAPGVLLRDAGALLLAGTPAALVLFLLLPRPQVNLPLDRGAGTSGLSDRMKPGEIASIALNQSAAFRVVLGDGKPANPENLYWRGLVLTEVNESGWFRDRSPYPLRDQPRAAPDTPPAMDPAIEQEITLLPHQRTWLFALDCPVDWARGVRPLAGSVLMRDEPVQNPLTYTVVSRPGRSTADADPAHRIRALREPPTVDPSVRALAAEWIARAERQGGANARGIAAAGLAWFSEQGFTYTLEPGRIDGDLVAGFLALKRGFCGHYSAAFALLMRLARIPTRVVIGYRGGEWNEPGGFLIVRQAHAHAWTEVWFEDERRWVRIDPTAAVTGLDTRRIASEGAQAIGEPADAAGGWRRTWRAGRQWWDWVNARWENVLFRFDAEAQQRLRDRLGLGKLGSLGAGLVVLGLAAATIAAGAGIAVLLRRRRPRTDPELALYERWCRDLAGAGCPRQPHEGPRDFAVRAAAALPGRAAEIAAVTDAYVAARYAASGDQGLPRLRAALRSAGGRGGGG